jgi:hypothetical protein
MMGAAKHTPAPWAVNHIDGEKFRIVDSRDLDQLSFIATVHFHDDEEGETKANARLIAAAPELLNRLDSLCDRIDKEGATPMDWPEFYAARESITKAKGEQA